MFHDPITMPAPGARYPRMAIVRHRITLFIVLALLTTAAMARPGPPDFTAKYEFRRNGIFLGDMTRRLTTNDDGSMRFSSRSQTRGLIAWLFPDKIDESSDFHYQQGRPRPDLYRYIHRGRKKRRHVEIRFDWQKHLASHSINDDPWQMTIPDDVQDKLIYQLTLMIDLEKARTTSPSYQVADGGHLKDYDFKIIGEERIDTPIGRLRTVRLMRLNDKRKTTIWCARAYHYLPVKIEQQDTDGSHLVLDISKITGIRRHSSP